MVLIMGIQSQFKDYRVYKEICAVFDEKTAYKMMKEASQCSSFVDNKDLRVNEIVCWSDTKHEIVWRTVYYSRDRGL
ncbi:hypothetical protein kvi_69 [Escherichia phage kvi]|uniref:Uncharacterized protein n=1 Tax=Escherichia phage kvi TaxID=2696413 RepID=A0A6B9X4W7_9CAUD|nr:hypothetical protein kvi_69 [Escherichia phage kvi]